MDRRTEIALTGLICFVGALIFLGLTVYPFQYGLAESAILAGAFVVAAIVETVLDDAFSGESSQ